MRAQGLMFTIITVFLGVTAIVYWFLAQEPAGTTALVLCAGLTALVGYYLLFTERRLELQPNDNPVGDIDDVAGDYGFYSPHSWWPLPLAGAGALVFVGAVFGWWISVVGAALGVISVIGFVFEYYRGDHAH